MPYLDNTGLTELWSNIKANFGHYMQSTTSDAGAVIKLYSGSNGTLGTDVTIPPATDTTCGIMTGAQASKLASLQTYTAGTNISISGGQISVIGLATVATSGAYSDLTGTPASLKNPSALTIGDVSYDGSDAKSITAGDNVTISGGKISATDTNNIFIATYGTTKSSEVSSALSSGKIVFCRRNNAYYQLQGTGDGYYSFCKAWYSDDYLGYYYSNLFLWYRNDTWSESDFEPLARTSDLDNYLKIDVASSTYAPLAGATFTGAVTLPTISGTTANDDTAATTAFVQAVVKASGAGVVHYRGAAASTEKLTNYVTGDYWVASAEFSYTGTDSKTVYIEKGDMLFANTTATDFVAANFDVVQANITAMTKDEVDDICTLD